MMTIEEIQRLRADKPREFDALVAEKVMGWRLDKKTPSGVRWWFDANGDAQTTGDSRVVGITFRPSDSPDSDYRVLRHVRDCYFCFENKYKLFAEAFANIVDERPGVLPDPLQYRPGDYAAAAIYATLSTPTTEVPKNG